MPGIRNSQLSVFFIMLKTIRVFFLFNILAHSQSDIKYAVQREFYCKAVLSVSIIWHRSEIYTAGSAEDVYIQIIVQSTWEALPAVIHILIGIISVHVPIVFNLPLIEIARTQFFVRWMDCNTPLLEYVLSCVFRFLDHIF